MFAFTQSGSWKYEEYDEVNTAGSYLFEPAGSIHTLVVPETNTEVTDVWFAIYGANLNLAEDGSVDLVIDAQMVYEFYVALCEAAGVTASPTSSALREPGVAGHSYLRPISRSRSRKLVPASGAGSPGCSVTATRAPE